MTIYEFTKANRGHKKGRTRRPCGAAHGSDQKVVVAMSHTRPAVPASHLCQHGCKLSAGPASRQRAGKEMREAPGGAPRSLQSWFSRPLGAHGLYLVGRDRLALVAPGCAFVVGDVGDIVIVQH